MQPNGIIAKKIELIAEGIGKLRELPELTLEVLQSDYFLKRGIERTLQVTIEAAIDIANRINSLLGQPPATTSFQAFEMLERNKVIVKADRYRKMIQFRNFVVHRYEALDNEILLDIIKNHLSELDTFTGEIQAYENR